MNSLAVVVAAMPGPPVYSFGIDMAPALVPVGIGLAVLAALGAIVVLLGRDACGATGSVRNAFPVIRTDEEPSLRHVA